MAEIECPTFTEDVACEIDGVYKIAQGWTTSTGSEGNFPYTLPAGWKYDPRYTDIFGLVGSHGGCANCFMTLVHLITVDPVIDDPCEGVLCTEDCTGYDLWSQKCVDGTCINDAIIETNSPTCGYVPPGESEWYDPIVDNWGYIFLLIAAGVTIDHVLE